MIRFLLTMLLVLALAPRAGAAQLMPPEPPGDTAMPRQTEDLAAGLWELVSSALGALGPDWKQACRTSLSLLAAALMMALLRWGQSKALADLAGTGVLAGTLLGSTRAMIRLGTTTVQQLCDYGKLLFPVMTSALAAQGGITSSAALYAATAMLDAVLSALIASLLIPMVYLFLALATANSALGEDLLKRLRDLLRGAVIWCLKILLTVFTTYMSITGVVSGATDAAALKAAKLTISTVVPVVGGILSDASESVLVGAEVMKNAAGIYGILTILAVFLQPFLRIGLHYLLLKATAAVCGIFGSGAGLIEDFSNAMGLLLAMTGSVCLMMLVSTVCFLKGVG